MKKQRDVAEWINKAEQDYQTATTMARKRSKPVPDVVGFHSQQCIEKYLKAFLVSKKVDFPKTHDLMELLEIANTKDPLMVNGYIQKGFTNSKSLFCTISLSRRNGNTGGIRFGFKNYEKDSKIL